MHTENTQPALARRSVLRTAAHAAWAVPAISVATAAPAFASSPGGVPVGAFSLTPDQAGLQGSNFSLTYNTEPWTAGPVYLTFSDPSGPFRNYSELYVTGGWMPDGPYEPGDPTMSVEPRFVYTGSITSGVPLNGMVFVYPYDWIPAGTQITATLGNATGSVAYAQRTASWIGW